MTAGLFARITLDASDRVIRFNTASGLPFRVQAQPHLNSSSWTTLGTAVENSPGSYEFRDASGPMASGYYRLVSP